MIDKTVSQPQQSNQYYDGPNNIFNNCTEHNFNQDDCYPYFHLSPTYASSVYNFRLLYFIMSIVHFCIYYLFIHIFLIYSTSINTIMPPNEEPIVTAVFSLEAIFLIH
jgi:hypothetical protein